MMEELQQFKIDYLAKEMQLSEKEKAEFVPLYKEYEKQRRETMGSVWRYERELKKKKDASDADYKKLAELQQNAREKDNVIVKNFDSKLESFLSAKQIYTMHEAEMKFLEKMKEMRKKHPGGHHNNDNKGIKHSERPQKDRKDSPCASEECPMPPTLF